jgi:amylase-binding protein abpA
VNGRKVNEYLAQQQERIDAEAAQDPAVVAAKSEFDAVEGGSHLYTEKKEAYESALNTARNNVRNRYVEEFQKKYNTASKEEKNYYILNETPEQKNARYLKEHGLDGNKGQNDQNVQNNSVAAAQKTEKNGGASAKAGKADSKQAGKALPKTSAAK